MGVKNTEKICRCLFIKWGENVVPVIVDNNEICPLNYHGENVWELDDCFWKNWKKAVSFESSQSVDFCIICDELFDIAVELQEKHCEYSESYWNKRSIRNVIDKIDIRNNIIVRNDNGVEIMSKSVMFSSSELILTAYYLKAQDEMPEEICSSSEKNDLCPGKTSKFAEYFMKKIEEDEMRRRR